MSILECRDVSKTIGTELVVDHVSFVLEEGETAVLNDREQKESGLSAAETLMAMTAGDIVCKNGEILLAEGKSLGTPSHLDGLMTGSGVYAEARSAIPDNNELKDTLYTMELGMMYMKNTAYMDLQREYDRLSKELEEGDGEKVEQEIEDTLTALGLDEETWLQMVGELSETDQHRMALAKILLAGTDLIILDHPEKFLSPDMISWTAGVIRGRGGAILAVSDDPEIFGKATRTITV